VTRLLRINDEFALVLRDIGALQERIQLLQDEISTNLVHRGEWAGPAAKRSISSE